MENTLENKAKFFAQYWGQEVLLWHQWTNPNERSKIGSTPMRNPNGWSLSLKPLSLITDEDKEYIGYSESYIDMLKKCNVSKIDSFVADYLRSKSCALPWMGLSVETMVEYGWIKLKEA